MIGFIGPADAVAAATEVALSMGMAQTFVPRTYSTSRDAPLLAAELDRLCDVILFAGQVPHRVALNCGRSFTATLQYVPESAVDLYHTVLALIRAGHDQMGRVAIDTVDRSLVQEVFAEIELPVPGALLPLDDIPGDWTDIADRLYEFHHDGVRAGRVDVCVTWLRAVHDRLRDAGIDVVRAEHTTSTYRDALTRAALNAEAHRSKAGQVVVGRAVSSARCASGTDDGLPIANAIAKELRGTVVPAEDGRGWLVYSTRGALDIALGRMRSGQDCSFVVNGRLVAAIGFGVGANLTEGTTCATRALSIAEASNQLCVVHATGLTHLLDATTTERIISMRDSAETITISGLGPVSTSRLIHSIRLLDAAGITAPQLASAYGVTPRSARRLLQHLKTIGVAERLGREGVLGPGRPRVVYRIDVDRLAAGVHSSPSTDDKGAAAFR